MLISSINNVAGPVFEKKTGRRNSILGGGNTEDGHVIKLVQKHGFSIDLKVLFVFVYYAVYCTAFFGYKKYC
jgi:hypothetical protein